LEFALVHICRGKPPLALAAVALPGQNFCRLRILQHAQVAARIGVFGASTAINLIAS
jgi:hypothetical protein